MTQSCTPFKGFFFFLNGLTFSLWEWWVEQILRKVPDKPECFYAFKLGKIQIFKTRRREEGSKRYLAGIVEMILHCIFLQCTYPGFLMHHFRILFHLLQGLVVNMTIPGGKIICMPLKEEENVLKILLWGSSIPKPSPNSPFPLEKLNWIWWVSYHLFLKLVVLLSSCARVFTFQY